MNIFFYVDTSVLPKSECVYFSTLQRMFQTDWQKKTKKKQQTIIQGKTGQRKIIFNHLYKLFNFHGR